MEPAPKRAKIEVDLEEEEEDSKNCVRTAVKEHERGLLALVEHRRQEVQQLTEQLMEAQKRLSDAEAQLAQIQNNLEPKTQEGCKILITEGNEPQVKMDPKSSSPGRSEHNGSRIAPQSRPQLLIPAATTKAGPPMRSADVTMKTSSMPATRTIASGHGPLEPSGNPSKPQTDASIAKAYSQPDLVDTQDNNPKQESERRDHVDLIDGIRSNETPCVMNVHLVNYISGQHKRKLRSLAMNDTVKHLCATSALDGVVNFWQIQDKRLTLSLLGTVDCLSPGQRRWPEDITWNPDGDKLFAAYSADGADHQVSIINMNASKRKVTFLEEKPHIKGVVNSIIFMPWDDVCFTTGGSDHGVVLWSEKEIEAGWKPETLHRNLHSSAVMGVAGMQQKQMVLSAGADKRIVGFDVEIARADFEHRLESKAMGVLPNPTDFNLFMVQTGTPEKQLRLFDIRVRVNEVHEFGWKQESSESQSALINQTWSPDGLYIASGSVDPKIHVFDIRYNSREPCQSIKAHQKRVFKAAWHSSLPLLISISSDLNIGLHKFSR